MAFTPAAIRTTLLLEVPEIGDVAIVEPEPHVVHILLKRHASAVDDDPTLLKKARAVLEPRTLAHVIARYSVEEQLPPDTRPPPHSRELRIAALSPDPSRFGVVSKLKSCLPGLDFDLNEVPQEDGSLTLELSIPPERYQDATVRLQCQRVLDAIMNAGAIYRVVPHMSGVGARTTKSIDIAPREDIAADLARLEVDNTLPVPVLDEPCASSVFLFGRRSAPDDLQVALPLFDRVYLGMPKGKDEPEGEPILGIPPEDFWQFVRAGKIVPVFNDAAEEYPPWLNERLRGDLSLRFVDEFDLRRAAARTLWNQAPLLRTMRESDEETRALKRLLLEPVVAARLESEIGPFAAKYYSESIKGWLRLASTFEEEIVRGGTTVWARYTPKAPLAPIMRGFEDLPNDERRQAAMLEVRFAAHSLGIAQSLGASLIDMADIRAFQLLGPVSMSSSQSPFGGSARDLKRVVTAFDLMYAPGVPAADYIEIMDTAETRRLRALLLPLEELTRTSEEEARGLVADYNKGIAKLRKRDLLRSGKVDAFGLVQEAAPLKADSIPGKVLKALRAVGSDLFDRIIEDSPAGAALDRIRGRMNRVPAASVRIYQIKSKLAATRKEKK